MSDETYVTVLRIEPAPDAKPEKDGKGYRVAAKARLEGGIALDEFKHFGLLRDAKAWIASGKFEVHGREYVFRNGRKCAVRFSLR